MREAPGGTVAEFTSRKRERSLSLRAEWRGERVLVRRAPRAGLSRGAGLVTPAGLNLRGLRSPLVCGSSMGFRSVRFSELHGRVVAVCMFCTREPSFSHPAPCALFVSARGTRHALAFVGLAQKFFRWNHGTPLRMEPTNPKIKSEAAWQFQHLYKGLQGIEWAILGDHSGGSMQVSTLRRRYSSSRSP